MIQHPVNTNDATSATTAEAQIPSTPNAMGSVSTARISKRKVLKKEIRPETSPLFNAVKKEDPA